jgi:hypothetical protein
MTMNIADWIAALGCLFAVKGLLQASNSSKKWMWYSFYVSVAVSVFWTYYLLKYVILQTTYLYLLCQNVSYHIILYQANATLAVRNTDQHLACRAYYSLNMIVVFRAGYQECDGMLFGSRLAL